MSRQSAVVQAVAEVLAHPELNGVYRLSQAVEGLAPVLDGRTLSDRGDLLVALGSVLGFPDYYGANWDALDECLQDMNWRDGAISVLIDHANAIPVSVMTMLADVFLSASSYWASAGRGCSLFLAGIERSDVPLLV
jgi:RNAse (barnase) inhibitor barstar